MAGWGWTDADQATGQTFDYNQGDSENQFLERNAFSKESGYGFTNFMNPVLGVASAFHGKSVYKKKRAAYERYLAARAKNKRANEYGQKMTQLDAQQGQEDAVRQQALDAVDDPASVANDNAEVEKGYNADVGNAYAGLSEQYGRDSQRQGLAAVRRGVQGGSNDSEQQADLGAGFQSHLIDATQSALGRASNDYRARSDSRSSLRRSILTGDAAQSGAWTEQARGEAARNEKESRMMDYMNAFNQLHQQQAETNSRLIGGGASAFADSYRVDQNAKGDGMQGLY